MRSRKKRSGVKFETGTVVDVGIAGIATRLIPQIVNKFLPLDPTLYAVAGAGGTYLLGSMLKKPIMATAGIALGLVELFSPFVEDLVGNIGGGTPTAVTKQLPGTEIIKALPQTTMSDYLDLSEYTNSPAVQSNLAYRNSY